MSPARSNLRSALDRLMVTAVAAPLVAIALVAPRDAAIAQSHIATLPVKHPSAIDGPKRVPGAKPVLAKPDREREAKSLHKPARCDEHGGCSGLVLSAGAPAPLRTVSFPIGAKPSIASGGTWIDASGGYPIGSTAGTGAGAGGTGGSTGGSAPLNTSPTRPPAPTDNGGAANEKF